MSKITDVLKVKKQDNPASVSLLLRIAIPLIITTSSQSIMQFVGRMFLAWYSADALAACVPAGLFSFTIISFFMGICGYTSVFVANYYGQKRYASLSVALWQGVIVGFFCGLIILALVPAGNFILGLSGHDPLVKAMEKEYFSIIASFGGLIVMNNALAGFFTGQGRTAVTMYVNVTGIILNIFLSYTFIFGKFGFDEMGITGAGWANVISSFSVTLIFLSMILRANERKKFRTYRLFGFNKKAALRLIKYGLPNGFSFFMDIFSFSVFVFFTGNIDKFSLAASNIVLTLQSLVFMPLMGLGIAAQMLMGQYIGRKQPEQGIKSTYTALKIGAVYAFTVCVAFLSAPGFFTGLFDGGSNHADMLIILEKTTPLIFILCIYTWGDLLYLMLGDAIRGAGDTKFHMKTMAVSAVFLIAASAVMIGVFNVGINAAWILLTGYIWIVGAVMAWRFWSRRWMGIDITA